MIRKSVLGSCVVDQFEVTLANRVVVFTSVLLLVQLATAASTVCLFFVNIP
jgi:hypothetical protein